MGILRPFYVDSPSTWDEQDDGLDFSADPDQRHDKLPQPFRLVDKILDSLFEDSWSAITIRQEAKESQANYRQLPNLEGGVKVTLPYKLHSICSTSDSELVIGAGEGGLLAFSHDDVTRPIFKYNIEGGYLQVGVVSGAEAETYIVAALDCQGVVTLFGITRAGFIEVSQLTIENEEKVLKMWLNESNIILSVVDEKDVTSLLFYTLPISSWTEPFEQISSLRLQGNEEEEQIFSKPETKGRIKRPSSVVPCSKCNLSDALTPIMNTLTNPVTLGQGTHHILPASYFENRRTMLEKLPKYQGIDWTTASTSVHVGNAAFVSDSKVIVWWSEHHIATLHSLQGDVETVVDNFVFTSEITCVAASYNGDKVAVGLAHGLVSVIDLKEMQTVQCSLVSRSRVCHVVFVEDKLLAACENGGVGVLSCDVESSCAMIQHIVTDKTPHYTISQMYRLAPYSNLAVIALSPGRVALVDVDSYRAIAVVPVWTGSAPWCASLTRKYLCVISLDAVAMTTALTALHPYAERYLQNTGPDSSQVPEMFVYDVSGNSEITERGYVNTADSKHLTLSLLSQSYFANRESEKCARHERLRERWFQYTEELESY